MAEVRWNQNPGVWTATLDGEPVCSLRAKDIGGVVASWLNGRLWAPPAHSPKAIPQPTKFFHAVDEAKSAVEQVLLG
jgi:hypothetical protein